MDQENNIFLCKFLSAIGFKLMLFSYLMKK